MTERLVSKLHVALLSYDEREIRVRKNYLEEQNPAICCVCFHSGEELLRELRQQRSVDIVVLSSQLEDMDGYEFLKRLNSLHNRPLLLLQGDDWYSDATASFLRPDGRQELLAVRMTNYDGFTEPFDVPTPPASDSQTRQTAETPYALAVLQAALCGVGHPAAGCEL